MEPKIQEGMKKQVYKKTEATNREEEEEEASEEKKDSKNQDHPRINTKRSDKNLINSDKTSSQESFSGNKLCNNILQKSYLEPSTWYWQEQRRKKKS